MEPKPIDTSRPTSLTEHGVRDQRYHTTKYSIMLSMFLHTGIQWKELQLSRKEISWQTIYHHHSRWSKDGSYKNLFLASIAEWDNWEN